MKKNGQSFKSNGTCKRGPPETKKRQQFAWITSKGNLQYGT